MIPFYKAAAAWRFCFHVRTRLKYCAITEQFLLKNFVSSMLILCQKPRLTDLRSWRRVCGSNHCFNTMDGQHSDRCAFRNAALPILRNGRPYLSQNFNLPGLFEWQYFFDDAALFSDNAIGISGYRAFAQGGHSRFENEDKQQQTDDRDKEKDQQLQPELHVQKIGYQRGQRASRKPDGCHVDGRCFSNQKKYDKDQPDYPHYESSFAPLATVPGGTLRQSCSRIKARLLMRISRRSASLR